jgi:hypothetical protein
MTRMTRDQRDAEARNAGAARQDAGQHRAAAPRRRKLGEVFDRSTADAHELSVRHPSLLGHLTPQHPHGLNSWQRSDDD